MLKMFLLNYLKTNRSSIVKAVSTVVGALIGVGLVAIRENTSNPIGTTIELVSTPTEDLNQ